MELLARVILIYSEKYDKTMAFTHEKCHLLTWQYSNEQLIKTTAATSCDCQVRARFQISFELCIKSCFNSATKPLAAVTNFCLGNLHVLKKTWPCLLCLALVVYWLGLLTVKQ